MVLGIKTHFSDFQNLLFKIHLLTRFLWTQYQDANCGNTLLISLEELVKDGLLMKEELPEPIDGDRVNYSTVADVKDPMIAKASKRLVLSEGDLKCQLEEFKKDPDITTYTRDPFSRESNPVSHIGSSRKGSERVLYKVESSASLTYSP